MKNKLLSFLILLEAVIVSALVRIVLNFFDSSVRLRWMGRPVEQGHSLPDPTEQQLQLLRKVKLAITRCARYVPWNTECYTLALTARIMLRRRQIPLLLVIGFKKEEGQSLHGHAWTYCGSYLVTGYRTDLNAYVINGSFL